MTSGDRTIAKELSLRTFVPEGLVTLVEQLVQLVKVACREGAGQVCRTPRWRAFEATTHNYTILLRIACRVAVGREN